MDPNASKEGHVVSVRDEEHGKETTSTAVDIRQGDVEPYTGRSWWQKITKWQAVESAGVQPVPVEDRTNRRVYNIFTLWFTLSLNLITIVTGMLGTVTYGLSLRNSSLVILFFTLIGCIPPALLSTFGPKTGLRMMVTARYSFGYYLVCVPVVLNMATLTGFCVTMNVTASLTLSAITNGRLTTTVGIVVISILSLLISFCGFKVLHQYEKYAWFPVLIAIIVAVGCGGKHLGNQVEVEDPETSTILSFGALVASFMIPWSALASDFATYMPPTASSKKVFLYTYSGLVVPSVTLLVLGAAMGGAMPNVPAWQAGYDSTSIGGVLAAMLEPAGGFGKFLLVILAFSVLGNIAATMYSISLNFQLLIPALVRVPRAFFAIVVTAVVIPVSIKAASSFFESVENFIGVIGYWSAAFVAVIIVEHFWFRKGDHQSYEHAKWNQPRLLPVGVAALSSAALSAALFIPCMDQVWYTGPIAQHTGDIGFEIAFAVTVLLYVPFRYLERKLTKGRN